MRFVVGSLALVLGCAGCDVLFQLRHVEGSASDAEMPDARPVPPQHCALPDPSAWTVSGLGSGTYYTIDQTATTAVYENGGMIFETQAGQLTTSQRLFPTVLGIEAPRLSPDGRELFMHLIMPCCSLVSSTKQGDGTWSFPAPVKLKVLVVGAGDLPGVPSAGIGAKRRMIISNATTDDFSELREDADGWTQVAAYNAQTLGMTDIQDGDLSPDGYRMYFGGTQSGMTNQGVFMVERTDLTVPFAAADVVEVRDTGQATPGVRTPYVTDDCKTLVLSIGSLNGSVRYGRAP